MNRRELLLSAAAIGSTALAGKALASNNEVRVTRFYGMNVTEVPTTSSASGFPSSLIMPPGNYMPAAPHDFTQPGLYQIWIPRTDSPMGIQWVYYRIVASTPYELATSMAWANLFGWGDFWPTQDTDQTMVNRLLGTPNPGVLLNVPCGPHIDFTGRRAGELGIDFRITHMLTAETPNSYSDGHISCEMRTGSGPWLCYDPSYAHIYTDQNDNQLNLADTINGLHSGTTKLEEISQWRLGNRERLTTYNVDGQMHGQWSVEAWAMADKMWLNGNEAAIRRAYQVPFIEDPANGEIVGYLPQGISMSMPLPSGYSLISEAAFRARFYP